MLGNRLGWCLAALLAIVFWQGWQQLAAIDRLTPPTGALADAAAPLASDVPAASVYAAAGPGDARALYQGAIDAVQREPARYDGPAVTGDESSIERSPAVAAIVAARAAAGDALADPAARATYDPPTDAVEALLQAGRCVGRVATHVGGATPAAAGLSQSLFEAEFALGSKLFDGRVRQTEAAAGLILMRESAAGLRGLADRANDARRAALLATFDRATARLEQRLDTAWSAVGAIDNTAIAKYAGDVYALAGPATAERMWRVEAILTLGRHQFAAERAADRLAVPRRLGELEAGERDPVVLAAIHAARGLTIEQFRMIR